MRGNGTTPSLEQQVAAALADKRIGPGELEDLIDKVEDGIHAAEADAARQREQAMDPALSPDLRAARQQLEDSVFLVGRLKTQLPRLQRRLVEVLDAERHFRWESDYKTVLAKRDQAVELFQQYPELVVKLLTILHTARDVDAECARVDAAAPSGEYRRLKSVELVARNLKEFSTAWPSIAASVTLPDIQNPGRMLWPPPKPFNAAMFAPVPFDRRYSAEWALVKEEEQRAAREEHEREQQEREAAAVEAQRRSVGRVWWLNECE
jgi:hypothetical protein